MHDRNLDHAEAVAAWFGVVHSALYDLLVAVEREIQATRTRIETAAPPRLPVVRTRGDGWMEASSRRDPGDEGDPS